MSEWLRGNFLSGLWRNSTTGFWQTPFGGTLDPSIPNLELENPPTAGAYTLTITSAAVTLTGTSVVLRVARRVTITSAAVTLTGSSVNLRRGPRVAITSAAVTTSGTSVSLRAARQLAVTSAAVTATGSSVSLLAERQLTVTSSPVTLTGSSVDLTYSQGSEPLPVETEQPRGGWSGWLNNLPRPSPYQDEDEDEPKPRRKKRRKQQQEYEPFVPAPDPLIERGIVNVPPAWDVMVGLQQMQQEAEIARLERLRAIALADDEWMMMV